jgi:hypothetical protein
MEVIEFGGVEKEGGREGGGGVGGGEEDAGLALVEVEGGFEKAEEAKSCWCCCC